MTLTLPTEAVSILFALLLALLAITLYRMQKAADTFDLKDVICDWIDGKQICSTSKTLLAGSFLVSSYFIVKNPTEMAYAAYLTAWVASRGISAWRDVKEFEVAR